MTRRWLCMNGHSGNGVPAACPACGVPVSIETVDSPPASAATATADLAPPFLQDLIFGGSGAGLAGLDRTWHRPASGAGLASSQESCHAGNGNGSSLPSSDETLQKPLGAISAPPQATIVPPSSELGWSADSGSPPQAAPRTAVQGGGPATAPAPPNHGETLIRPSEMSATPAVSAQAQAAVPSGYEILGVLGRGGMGVVYKARQVGLNRLVALKMILSGAHASTEELARFRIEAEAVARLRHPNIVQIFDIGERDGRPYFALEYCEGGSLQQTLDGTPIEPRRAATLLATLASAIDHAHAAGIVHRDLKPANILLTADGAPRITDFGLAKRLDDDQGQTGTEAVLGTPTYMAPEQAHGKTREVGPRADIYSLGAIFYDLLTGRPPFRGATALDTLQMVQTAEPIPPTRLQPGVPADLQTICLKCLEKEPGKRYASAAALADDLRAFLDGRPILARPTTTFERTWKWARRKPALAALVALAFFTPLVVAAISVGFSLHLAVLNNQIVNQNETLQEQKTALAEGNATLQTQSDLLANQKSRLESQKDDLEKSQKRLRATLTDLKDRQEKLERALSGERSAQKDAQSSFLEALTAADDLLNLARVELRKPGNESLRQVLLRRAVGMCRRFTARPGDYPVARLRAARAYRLAGDLESALGSTSASIRDYDEATTYLTGLIHEGDKSAIQGVDYLAESLDINVQLWGILGRTNSPRAETVLRETLSRIEKLDNSTQARPEYLRPHALLIGNHGLVHQIRGELGLARKDYDQAITWLSRLANRPDCQLERARLLIHRASLTSQAGGNTASARKDCREAIASLSKLGKPADNPLIAAEVGRAHSIAAGLAAAETELDAARQHYRDAVALFQELHQQAPQVADYTHLLAVARGELGSHLLRMNKAEPARKELDASLASLRQLIERFPDVPTYRFDLGRILTSEGVALVGTGDLAGAAKSFEAAVAAFAALRKSQPARPDIRLALLGVYRNLIYCRDHQARQAMARSGSRVAARHVAELVELRQKYEYALRQPGGVTTGSERVRIYWDRLLVRHELLRTLRSLAAVLESDGAHEGMVRAMADLKTLVHGDWSGGLRSAATVARAMTLASQDRSLSLAERTRKAREYGKQALEWLGPLARRGLPGLGERLDSGEFMTLRSLYPAEARQLREVWQRATETLTGR